eukprot:CCRYP_017295-RA/>CCRYP_017295-RA protein AED:0.13 eAED:0.13 QI:410/1/1/1/0.88/0.8/10/301/1054
MGACMSKHGHSAVAVPTSRDDGNRGKVEANNKDSSSSSPRADSSTQPESPGSRSHKAADQQQGQRSQPEHHRNVSTDSSYYSVDDNSSANGTDQSTSNGGTTQRRKSRLFGHSDSKLGLNNDILSGDLKNPNLVRIEVPLGKPIEEVYEGVHDGPVLGSGISGIVRLVKHRATQVAYAVKCLDLALIDSEEGLRQLKEEIYIMCQLDHPNIVRLEEVYESHSEIYLVQEVCKGGELFDRLDEQPDYHYTEAQCARLVKQMLSSLTYIHNKGIIHRDLKLENFLFSDTGADSELKMIDFGLSKHFTFGEVQHEAVGTPYTVAPEVIKGSYDERCDVWAIGVITYLLLSGEPPFGGCGGPETLMQVRDNILRGAFKFEPKEIWATVSREAKDFIRSLLILDPMKRPTAKQAKESKWLKMWRHRENGNEAPVINPNVVKALVGFKEYSDMRKLLCEVLSFTLLPEQIQGLRVEFEKYDREGTGEITLSTLKNVLIGNAATGSLGGLTEGEVEDIFNALRVRKGETSIHWHDFIAAGLSQCEVDDRNLRLAFERLDLERKGFISFENVMELLGNETFHQNEDAMLRMWGESMGDVDCANCTSALINYEDFVLLMKGQKRVVNVRRSLEPLSSLPEMSLEDDTEETDDGERLGFVSPESDISADNVLSDSFRLQNDMPHDLSSSPPEHGFHRQGSSSAPPTPSHIGKRFNTIDQTDSPLGIGSDGRVTFGENIFSIPPLDLTPPQTPVRGPQDYVTPTAKRVSINPQVLASLKPPELSLPGSNSLHSSFTKGSLARGRSVSLDEKDTFTAKMAAESRASMMFKRDSRRAIAIPEHTHNISELEKIIKDESKTPLVVNRRLYRAHREFRHSVTEACKRFEDEQLRRARETLKAQENDLHSKHTAGLVMRHGQALSDQSIKNFLKKTMEEQQAAVDQANRRGGRGKTSRKKTISDMSGMLGPSTPEPPMDKKTLGDRQTMFEGGRSAENERLSNVMELQPVKEHENLHENLLRNPTKPGEFRKTNYDPFRQRKPNLLYAPYSPITTAQQAPTDAGPPPLPL